MFLLEEQIKNLKFKSVGKNVLISDKASIYGAENMSIGNNVRIDDFCILSGKIILKNNIHLSAGSMLFAGNAGITFEDFSCLSSRGAVYAITDDYSGVAMTNPTVPNKYKQVTEQAVTIGKHCVIGAGSTILPGVNISEGTAVGAMSLVNKSTNAWGLYYGIPAKRIKDRKKNVLDLEKQYLIENVNEVTNV